MAVCKVRYLFHTKRTKEGSTLLLVLLILAVGTTILTTAMSTSRSHQKTAGIRSGSQKLRQFAEVCANLGVTNAQLVKLVPLSLNTLLTNNEGLSQDLDNIRCTANWTDNDDGDSNTLSDVDGTIYVNATADNLSTGYRSTLKMLINVNDSGYIDIYSVSDQ
jgi:hypothetical protein